MLLLMGGLSSGVAYAEQPKDKSEFDIVQQNATCQGIVKDATGETVIGASVIVQGTTNGTITDIDGNFSLPNVNKGDLIEISFVGYITQTVKWDGSPINVILKEDTQTLEEVVVTGYGGKQLRTKVTNSISKVNNEALTTGVHSNPAQALSGAVAGLRVVQSSGNPGAKPNIVLRGGTNFQGDASLNEPLVMVDARFVQVV